MGRERKGQLGEMLKEGFRGSESEQRVSEAGRSKEGMQTPNDSETLCNSEGCVSINSSKETRRAALWGLRGGWRTGKEMR